MVQRFRRRRIDLSQNLETVGILLVSKVHLRIGRRRFSTAPLFFAAAAVGVGGGGWTCSFHNFKKKYLLIDNRRYVETINLLIPSKNKK